MFLAFLLCGEGDFLSGDRRGYIILCGGGVDVGAEAGVEEVGEWVGTGGAEGAEL